MLLRNGVIMAAEVRNNLVHLYTCVLDILNVCNDVIASLVKVSSGIDNKN